MNTVEKFITNTLQEFIPRKEYSVAAVVHKLEREISLLHQWLIDNEPDTGLWRMKRSEMLRKIENLDEIKTENQLQ